VLWTQEVLLHPDASGGSDPVRAFSLGEQPSDGLAHRLEVTGVRDQQTRSAGVDLVPDAAELDQLGRVGEQNPLDDAAVARPAYCSTPQG
jgi:hypothetical protein